MPTHTIVTALWPLEELPAVGIGWGVFLGLEDAPELADLTEGERVLLVEPNELQADATVHLVDVNERRAWFGEIGNRDAIRVMYPAQSVQDHTAEAVS